MALAPIVRRTLGITALAAGALGEDGYRAEIESWRQSREERLKADGGWLSVEGLFWLEPGESSFGSDQRNTFVLPASAPPRAGVLVHDAGLTRFRIEADVTAQLGGTTVREGTLRPDSDEVLDFGAVTVQIIERGGRQAVRVKDRQSPRRRSFKGLRYYPVREAYRREARFIPYAQPKTLEIASVTGQVIPMASPGYVEFTIGGQHVRLDPVFEEPGANELFFIFRDATAPKETYGAGRFLYAALPKAGVVVLDFNKAYSPPCAFTPYATCPLPPKRNRLAVRIEAGELDPQVLH